MSTGPRRVLLAFAILSISIVAHARILRAGWLGDDLPHLAAAARAASPGDGSASQAIGRAEAWGWLADGGTRPIPGLARIAHARALGGLEASASHAGARAARLGAWAVLLLAAAASGIALRRALRPWTGDEHAEAAGFALALLFATHPLGTAAIARPAAWADVCAVLCGAASVALFLRGRQSAQRGSVIAAVIAAIAAGASAPSAILLAPLLAVLELTSARRARPAARRARTAATTLVVSAAAVLVERMLAALVGASPALAARGAWDDPDGPAGASALLARAVEKLGVVFLPVPGGDAGTRAPWEEYLVLCALVLLAGQPVLRAARAAPRLWGWLALCWLTALAASLGFHGTTRVAPADFSRAHLLVPACLAACVGLAVGATALSGARRVILPLALALASAWIGDRAASSFVAASDAFHDLLADVRAARAGGPPALEVWLVDPPRRAAGLSLGLEGIAWLPSPSGDRPRAPRCVTRAALDLLAWQPEFAAARRTGLALIVPGGSWPESGAGTAGLDRARAIVPIPPSAGSAPPITWRERGLSPLFDVDPALVHAARIHTLPATSTAEAPRILWRASGGVEEPPGENRSDSARAIGVWIADQAGVSAVFDLARAPDWWSARSIRRVWTEGALVSIALVELGRAAELAVLEREPRVAESNWRFALVQDAEPRPLRGGLDYVLELLDLGTFEFARISGTRSAADGRVTLDAPGAAGFERARTRTPGELAWCLEARVGPVAVARVTGRR